MVVVTGGKPRGAEQEAEGGLSLPGTIRRPSGRPSPRGMLSDHLSSDKPDAVAASRSLASRFGVPYSNVRANPDVFDARARQFELDDAARRDPALGGILGRSPQVREMAADDAAGLQRVSEAADAFSVRYQQPSISEDAWRLAEQHEYDSIPWSRNLKSRFLSGIDRIRSGYHFGAGMFWADREVPDLADRHFERSADIALQSMAATPRNPEIQQFQQSLEGKGFLESVGETVQFYAVEEPLEGLGLIAESIPNMAFGIGFGAGAGFAARGASALARKAALGAGYGLGTYAPEYLLALKEAMRNFGIDPDSVPPAQLSAMMENPAFAKKLIGVANRKALAVAGFNALSIGIAATRVVPLAFAGSGIPSVLRIPAEGVAQAAVQGTLEGTGEAVSGLWAYGELDAHEVGAEIVAGGATALIETPAARTVAGTRKAARAAAYASQRRSMLQSMRAQAEGLPDAISAMRKEWNSSKLASRDADAMSELVESHLGGSRNLYISAKAAYAADQSVLDALGASRAEAESQAETGGWVSVPMGALLSRDVDLSSLAGDIKAGIGNLTLNEISAYESGVGKEVAGILASLPDSSDISQQAAMRGIRAITQGELLAAGRTPRQAEVESEKIARDYLAEFRLAATKGDGRTLSEYFDDARRRVISGKGVVGNAGQARQENAEEGQRAQVAPSFYQTADAENREASAGLDAFMGSSIATADGSAGSTPVPFVPVSPDAPAYVFLGTPEHIRQPGPGVYIRSENPLRLAPDDPVELPDGNVLDAQSLFEDEFAHSVPAARQWAANQGYDSIVLDFADAGGRRSMGIIPATDGQVLSTSDPLVGGRDEGPPLKAVHSLDLPSLLAALREGTLVNPSIAVLPNHHQHMFHKSENIDLIFRPGAIDWSTVDAGTRDIYAQTYPDHKLGDIPGADPSLPVSERRTVSSLDLTHDELAVAMKDIEAAGKGARLPMDPDRILEMRLAGDEVTLPAFPELVSAVMREEDRKHKDEISARWIENDAEWLMGQSAPRLSSAKEARDAAARLMQGIKAFGEWDAGERGREYRDFFNSLEHDETIEDIGQSTRKMVPNIRLSEIERWSDLRLGEEALQQANDPMDEITDGMVSDWGAILRDWLLGQPQRFLEVKSQNPIPVGMVAKAVLPTGVSQEVHDMLRAAGIEPMERPMDYTGLDQSHPDAVFQLRRRKGPILGRFLPESRIIEIFSQADASTALHESFHASLSAMAALDRSRGIDPEMKARLFNALGINDWSQIEGNSRRAQDAHEKFAQAGEVYLFEGRLPANADPDLKLALQAASDMIRTAYETRKEISRGLPIHVDDEILAVFDRLAMGMAFADRAAANPYYVDAFPGAAAAGMTEDEWADMKSRAGQSKRDAAFKAVAELLDDVSKGKYRLRRELRADINAEARKDVSGDPFWIAVASIRDGIDLRTGGAVAPAKLDYWAVMGMEGETPSPKASQWREAEIRTLSPMHSDTDQEPRWFGI